VKRRTWRIPLAGALAGGLMLLAILSSSASGSATAAAAGPLKLGVLAPLTGSVAPEGAALTAGIKLAVAKIDASGGVLGKPITLYTLDTQANPSLATLDARKLIEQDQVNVLYGTILGNESAPVEKLATAARIPFMKQILDDYLHSNTCSNYYYKLGESDYQLLSSLVPFMIHKYGKKVALVGDDYSFPHAYNETAKTLIARAGGTVVSEQYSPLGTSEWSSTIGKLSSAKPSWVLSSVVGGDAIAFLKQAHSLGFKAPITGVSLNAEFYPALGGITDGSYVTVRYTDQIATAANRAFVKAFRAANPGDAAPIASVTANAYTGLLLLAKAINAKGSLSSSAILAGLKTVSLSNTIYGPGTISFNPANNILSANIYLVQVEAANVYKIIKNEGVTPDPTKC
jgi:urea transport system substrate-binding protein